MFVHIFPDQNVIIKASQDTVVH